MNRQQLIEQILKKKTFLCVGLDTDINKIPAHLRNEEYPIFAFNKAIIDATAPYCVAYKPNLAFYECYGLKGMKAFEKTVNYLKKTIPSISSLRTPSAVISVTRLPCTPKPSLRNMI